ncbi:hypothetical protein VPH35_074833 [Triticum aestivum]
MVILGGPSLNSSSSAVGPERVTSSTKADRRSHGGRGPSPLFIAGPLFALFSPPLDPTYRAPPLPHCSSSSSSLSPQQSREHSLTVDYPSTPLLQSEDTT